MIVKAINKLSQPVGRVNIKSQTAKIIVVQATFMGIAKRNMVHLFALLWFEIKYNSVMMAVF